MLGVQSGQARLVARVLGMQSGQARLAEEERERRGKKVAFQKLIWKKKLFLEGTLDENEFFF